MCWQVIKQEPSFSDSWRISWYFCETVIAVNTREQVNLILLVVKQKFMSLSGSILHLRFSGNSYIPLTYDPSMPALQSLFTLITRFSISSFIFFLIWISEFERESHSSNLINSTFNFSRGSIDSDGYCIDSSHSGREVYKNVRMTFICKADYLLEIIIEWFIHFIFFNWIMLFNGKVWECV